MFLSLVAAWATCQLGTEQFGPVRTMESDWVKVEGKDVQVTLTYRWIISSGQGTAPEGPNPILICTNTCKGKVHQKHKECDLSCDVPCELTHRLELHGKAQRELPKLLSRFDELSKLWYGEAGRRQFPYRVLTDMAYDKFNEEVERTKPLLDYTGEADHFGKPCSVSRRSGFYDVRGIGVALQAELRDRNGKVVRKTGTNYAFIGTISVPQPANAITTHLSKCACEPIKQVGEREPDDQHASVIQPPGVTLTNPQGINVPVGPDTCTVAFSGCGNINELECTVTNHTDQPLLCSIAPGTMCIGPKEYQQMMISKFNKQNIPGMMNLFAGMGGARPTVFRVPALCIEMHKDTPAAGASYAYSPTAPDGLAALGRIIDQGSFNGPWDQAMTWIWTDGASLDQVNERLVFPKCTPGYYLWGLWNVANTGSKPLPDLLKLLKPEFLMAWDAKSKPTKWMIEQEARTHPAEFAATVEGDLKPMAKKLATGGPVADIQHVADIADGLCASSDPGLQMLGLKVLSDVVPENLRFDIIRKGGLDDLGLLLLSKDSNVHGKAAEVTASYLPKVEQVNKVLATGLRSIQEAPPR